ncbi:MAG TPA: tetratricopeptide repeat protein [Edaphobacter sp.]|nr:tetratricopeptide repeat protein [Edaphobacter sp.]
MKNCVKLLLLLLLVSPLSGLCQQKQDAALASLMATAQQAQASNDYSTAVNNYKQAIKLRPDIPELWANLGLMQHEAKDYEDAVQSFHQALRLKSSLYVPNLFLGIDDLRIGKAPEAIPYLLKAEKMSATDSLPPLTLGQAYSSLGKFLPAAHAYERALYLDPKKSSAWFGLGIVRLDQVEKDARRLAREDQNSAYAKALYAESLVKQSRYKEAASSYKSALAITPQPPCIHAELGFLALKQQDSDGAQAEFETERRIDPGCSLAMLGQARLRMDAGSDSDALRLLKDLWERDPGFIQSNASSLMDGIEPARASNFQQHLFQQNGVGAVTSEFYQVLSSILSGEPQPLQKTLMPSDATRHAVQDSYTSGKYGQCAADFKRSITTKDADGLEMLATCAYFTGDYDLSANASEALAAIAPHSMGALYWSIKANEHLAFSALDEFQRLEPNSARSHLLLGDIYRQRRRFDDAQAEYEKALAIAPNDTAALTGLASAYLGDAKFEKTMDTAKLGLDQTPGDPELNLLMGEALVARHQMVDAKPFLRKALGAKPQMLPHVHALLGQVYAEAGKTSQAIEQLKLGLQSDEDGSLHYQLARLYRQTGDTAAAAVAIDQMKSIQQQHRQRAVIALEDTHPSTLDDGP